jgi:hypothetical protein
MLHTARVHASMSVRCDAYFLYCVHHVHHRVAFLDYGRCYLPTKKKKFTCFASHVVVMKGELHMVSEQVQPYECE